MTDSVSIFAEGTFEEQVQELAEYIARSRPEAERQAFTSTFEESLKTGEGQTPVEEDTGRKQRIILQVVDSVDSLGEGSDKEIEGFFNLLSSHILSLYPANSPEFLAEVSKIADIVSRSRHEQGSVKYRVLANLFNAIPRTSPARLVVCNALLRLAAANDELDTLHLSAADVNRWLSEWGVSSEEKSNFLKAVSDAFLDSGNFEAGYTFNVLYVQSLPASSSTEPAALQLVALALRAPAVFNFDSVLKIQNVQAQRSHPLFGLLKIVNEQGLGDLRSWIGKSGSLLADYQLDASSLERKVRLLALSELGFGKIGQNVPYTDIASALQIEVTEVEKWVIDVIRAGLLSGKLSQVSQTLLVVRAAPRGFTVEHWKALEERLVAWKEGLAGIQGVLASAAHTGSSTALTSSLNPQEQTA